MTSQIEREIRLILTGKTGSGKSSLGNALLQKHVFKTGCSGSSISKKCECRTERIHGYQIKVTDTPGLCDTNDDVEMNAEMDNCIKLSLPGPHVFLHVISIGRFTKEDFDSIKTFISKFGRDVNRYYLLVLTRFDDCKRDNNVDVLDFESLTNNLTCEWKTFLNETFADRFFPFDNTLSGKSSIDQVSVLLQKIDDIISANNGKSYTNDDFKRANQLIKEEREKMLAELDREREAEKTRIRHLEEERANAELQRHLTEQRARAELELQAFQERENREREQRADELRVALEQRMHQRQLQERGDLNFEQAVHGIFQIAELALNVYNMFSVEVNKNPLSPGEIFRGVVSVAQFANNTYSLYQTFGNGHNGKRIFNEHATSSDLTTPDSSEINVNSETKDLPSNKSNIETRPFHFPFTNGEIMRLQIEQMLKQTNK